MNQPKPIVFTKSGYVTLQKKYETLQEQRKIAVTQLQKAREMGDLSENGFYKASKAQLGSIDHQLNRTKYLLRFGVITDQTNSDTITIGSCIMIHDGKKQREIMVVGEHEADPSEGKISFRSPLGKGLLGRKIGENVCIETPRGEVYYNIIKIT